MADKDMTRKWIRYYAELEDLKALAINSQAGSGMEEIVKAAEEFFGKNVIGKRPEE